MASFGGKLGQKMLPDLLRDIAFRRFSGFLRLCRDETSRSIAFDSGEPINAFSTIPSEQIDARLIRDGHTNAGLVSAAKRSQQDPALLGAALVEKGIVNRELLNKTESELATEIALSAFEWTEADFNFEEAEKLACARTLETGIAELVTEGTRQAAAKVAFVDFVAPSHLTVMRNETAGDDLAATAKLNSTEGYIFSLTNSPIRISAIATLSGLPEEQIRAAVCVLRALGLLTLVDQSQEVAAAQPAQVDSADEVIRGIARKLRQFETATFYEILGVDNLATNPGIDRAYEQLAAMFTSHRTDYADRADVQRQIDELFGKIKTAHQTLKDPLKRREYDWQSSARRMPGSGGNGRSSQPSSRSAAPNTAVPIPATIPATTSTKPDNRESIIERGHASDSPGRGAQLPPRKPIPIPELQMPVAPKTEGRGRIERGQWDGSGLTPTPPRASGPLTRPPAVLSPEEVSRLQKPANKDQQALHFYRQGRLRLERRELDAATHLFREAVRLDPSQSHYHFYLATVLSIQAHARHEHVHHEGCHVTCKLGGKIIRNPKVRYEAEKHFRRAAEIDPINAQIVLRLGQLYKEAGLLKKAELYLVQALTLDSNNHEARRELDALHQVPPEGEPDDDDLDVEVRYD
jgi:curved DNA-binding protein CbpA